MTFAKASALAAGLVGAMVFGIWVSPYVVGERGTSARTAVERVEQVAVVEPSVPAADTELARPARAKVVTTRTSAPKKTDSGVIGFSPELHKRLKGVLNEGADLSLASEGFPSAEQFATVAHVSHNTEVPFMVLKHRVLSEGMTIPAAILASKPDANATAETSRAKAEAMLDLAAEPQVATNQN